jgi:hypothetical protein
LEQRLSFQKSKGKPIKPTKLVKVKQMGHIVEVKCVDKKSDNLQKIRKISKTQYCILETGAIEYYNLSENRSQSISSFRKTTSRIRDLINNNFTGAKNELFLTLTYSENMTDTKRLYKDFDKFIKRFKYKHGKDIEYLNIVEPQERGAWHMHILIKFIGLDTIFIKNNEIAQIWGQGFTKTKRLNQVDNIGAYLSAYLADIEINEENWMQYIDKPITLKEVITEDGKQKKFVKGGRVHLYPSGMNIVRHSKGIEYPEEQEITYEKAKKIVGAVTPNYSSSVTILDGNDKLLNSITYEYYNLKRD